MSYIGQAICILTFSIASVTGYNPFCQCYPYNDHIQIHYCNADFAFRAIVLAKDNYNETNLDEPSTRFTMDVVDVFREKNLANITRGITHVWTIASCQAFFTLTAEYVVMGTVTDSGLLLSTFCNLNPIWLSLSDEQQQAFYLGFPRSCRCNIKTCEFEIGSELCPTRRRYCVLRSDFPNNLISYCYKRYSFCRRISGICTFVKRDELTSCLALQNSIVESFSNSSSQSGEFSGDHSSGDYSGDLLLGEPELVP